MYALRPNVRSERLGTDRWVKCNDPLSTGEGDGNAEKSCVPELALEFPTEVAMPSALKKYVLV